MRTRGATLAATAVPAGLLTGMIGQLLLLAAVAGIVGGLGVGLSAAGWVAGVACGVIIDTALARGLVHYRFDRLTLADWVTLARATLAACVAALVVDSFDRSVPAAILVSLSAVALVLDAVDGWIARRTSTARALGAHFDAEVDAFLILILSVYVARSLGAWVLAIGAARYAFLAAGWLLPWMREPLPPRHWRKVVAATQGIVLTVAAARVLPPAAAKTMVAAALLLLAESFGRDIQTLRSNRPAATTPARSSRTRTGLAIALTTLAGLLVWIALVAPRKPLHLEPSAFLRIPLEGLVLIAAAAALPATARRVLAWSTGPVLGLVFILKVLDLGFFTAFDRPFDPYQDASYAGIGSETLRASIGASDAHLVIAGLVLVVVALLVLTTLAVRRVTNVAARHRRRTLQAVTALAPVYTLCW